MSNLLIAKYLKSHAAANNSTSYAPAWVNQDARPADVGSGLGSTGYYSPIYFGIHNPGGTAITVTLFTINQGTSGGGCVVKINAGETFYATIAKVTVSGSDTVVLLGSEYNPNYL